MRGWGCYCYIVPLASRNSKKTDTNSFGLVLLATATAAFYSCIIFLSFWQSAYNIQSGYI